jgi:protein required for attachment to host cells
MAKLKIGEGTWVVVCDGAKALVLTNAGDEKFLNLKTLHVFEQEAPRTHEQGTDAPGRTLNAIDGRRSAMDQTDWHERDERRFLRELASRLEAAINGGQAESFVIIAPPRALGVLRQAYSQAVRSALNAEVDKDLVKLPLHEIEKHLAA